MSEPTSNNLEVSSYLKSLLTAVSNGIPDNLYMTSGMKVSVRISNEVKIEGGVRVIVGHVGGDKTSSSDTSVEFQVAPLSEPDSE